MVSPADQRFRLESDPRVNIKCSHSNERLLEEDGDGDGDGNSRIRGGNDYVIIESDDNDGDAAAFNVV